MKYEPVGRTTLCPKNMIQGGQGFAHPMRLIKFILIISQFFRVKTYKNAQGVFFSSLIDSLIFLSFDISADGFFISTCSRCLPCPEFMARDILGFVTCKSSLMFGREAAFGPI